MAGMRPVHSRVDGASDTVTSMASEDRVTRYQTIVKELTELIGLADSADFAQREQEALPRVHEQYFAAVSDLRRPQD